MMAGPMASPASSTGTVPDHCEVQPTPTTRSGATPLSASAWRAEATTASHHSRGDCSAPPSSVSSRPTDRKACATMRPEPDRTAALGPPVPRSTARTKVSSGPALVTVRSSVAGRAWRPDLGVGMAQKRTQRGQPPSGPATGPSVGQAGFRLDLVDDLVAHAHAAVQQCVVEADAEVAPVDLCASRKGHDGLALDHGRALAQELDVEVEGLGDAADRQVGGQDPVVVLRRLEGGALEGQGRVIRDVEEVIGPQVLVALLHVGVDTGRLHG